MTEKPDRGLRTLLTWTFVALVAAIIAAMIGVDLVIRFFDPHATP